jgi:hypothetical protein
MLGSWLLIDALPWFFLIFIAAFFAAIFYFILINYTLIIRQNNA